jgi:putative radical SAM enzyme (TIGR03279 family)
VISVKTIETGTLADRLGFEPGDRILSINGERIADLIDFQVHSSDEILDFEIERRDEVYEVQAERQPGEAMGLAFEEMRLRQCNNKCVFCFLHQMPKGLRRTLYFEDDDYRLSFLHGSYVTLTNLNDADLQRIIDQRLSPQYISVHATDPEVRQQLLGRNKQTVPILERIELLASHGIEMHAQIVVCPGLNDGPHLERTVRELAAVYPAVRSAALVPVGLTRFRDHLPNLQPVTESLARTYVAAIEAWGNEFTEATGERFVYAADELFLLCGRHPPDADYYDAFPQIENGIGMLRTFLDTWDRRKGEVIDAARSSPRRIAVVTGCLAGRFLPVLVEGLADISGFEIEVVVVENEFFGSGITVSGLLSGKDIGAALSAGDWDLGLLPPNCINGDGLTLDDFTIAQLEELSGVPLRVGSYDLAASIISSIRDEVGAPIGSGRQLSELGFYVGKKQ